MSSQHHRAVTSTQKPVMGELETIAYDKSLKVEYNQNRSQIHRPNYNSNITFLYKDKYLNDSKHSDQ